MKHKRDVIMDMVLNILMRQDENDLYQSDITWCKTLKENRELLVKTFKDIKF